MQGQFQQEVHKHTSGVDAMETCNAKRNIFTKRVKWTPRNTNLLESEESTITLEEIQRLHTLLSYTSSTVDCKEVDSILTKFGLNVTNLSSIKDMLKSSIEGTGALVFESFYKEFSSDRKWKKDILESVEPL